ncbi:hypothetical protein CVU75_00285 [Candidatus Dependentiae bacterium HGW-Dependentiae-1]|nr:MAG: hypothetical protein CVU75_00285 [Candidatus Dependentiae bacterium HGW-Dependentiae-1]
MNHFKLFLALLCITPAAYTMQVMISENDQIALSDRDLEKYSIRDIADLTKNSPAGTTEYIIGLKLYDGVEIEEKNQPAALSQFLKAAKKGHVNACAKVSMMYLNGEGTPKNNAKYLEFLEKAAQLGSPYAQYNYGVIIAGGVLGIGRLNEGVEWLKKAAAQKFGAALSGLGVMAREGIDDFGNHIEPDYEKAFELFRESAAKESHAGMFCLAQFYKSGLAGKKNAAEAKKLFDEILESDNANSLVFKALMHETGSGVDKNLMKAKYYYELCAQNPIDLEAALGLARVNKKIAEQEQASLAFLEEETAKTSAPQRKLKTKTSLQATQSIHNANKNTVLTAHAPTQKQKSTTRLPDVDFDIAGETLKNKLNQALSYDDGSTITEINTAENRIVIQNPHDGSTVTLFTDRLTAKHIKSLKKLTYDDRVKKWFAKVQEPSETTQEQRERHRFAQRVDEIVQLYGEDAVFFKQNGTLEENKFLDGFITTKNGDTLYGRFEYALYENQATNKILYHRFFHPHSKAMTTSSAFRPCLPT